MRPCFSPPSKMCEIAFFPSSSSFSSSSFSCFLSSHLKSTVKKRGAATTTTAGAGAGAGVPCHSLYFSFSFILSHCCFHFRHILFLPTPSSLSLSALLSPVTHEGRALAGVNAVIRRIEELISSEATAHGHGKGDDNDDGVGRAVHQPGLYGRKGGREGRVRRQEEYVQNTHIGDGNAWWGHCRPPQV